MSEVFHSVVGLPHSGKTTFLAAIWHLINAGEMSTKLIVKELRGNTAYLNEIADRWRQCASRYTPKPANEVHLKTGQRKRTQDNISFNLNQLFQQDFSLLPWRRVVVN